MRAPVPHPQLLAIFLLIIGITSATISEYADNSQSLLPCEHARERAHRNGNNDYIPQCSEYGLYRKIQCSRNGSSCWCVDENGVEVSSSKQLGAPPVCLSFCQLKKQQILVSGYINRTSITHIPQCKDSGEFEPVQCDQILGQCWCVDNDGMEIYGTRQVGKPLKCPQSCEIRDRRILHGVGEKVPPHCSSTGEFLPVQCKLVNTTDKMIIDVVTSFSRFPNAFKSISSLRESFPEISGYCYCADTLGRELADTGLELLLGEVQDTEDFAGQFRSRLFTDTAVYRILQRRFLGVQLIISGKFRCPSICEVQRFTASSMGDVYTPSCTDNGDYEPAQCQVGGQCWCVDSKGREIYGSRIQGESPNCNNHQDCSTSRRQALSSLFFGPTGHFGQNSLFVTQEEELGTKINTNHCPSYISESYQKSGLLIPISEKFKNTQPKLENFISDMVNGLFASRNLIQVALKSKSNFKIFQQNLFGGKYLKNMAGLNFTGSVGTRSKFNFSEFFQQIGLTGMYSGGNFIELAKLFSSEENSYLTKESSNFSKQSFELSQPIQGSFGQTVNLKENQNRVTLFESILEQEEFTTLLRKVISFPPKISQDISEAVQIVMQSKNCEKRNLDGFVPTCTEDGRFNEIQCSKSECWCVDYQGKEIEGSRTQDKQPRCPTKCVKEREQQKLIKKSLPAGSEPYVPSCDLKGDFYPVQCSGKQCFCVNMEGGTIPGTRKLSGENIQCPSKCQLTASNAFLETAKMLLADTGSAVQLSQVYIPQCLENGDWRSVQCSGPTEQALEVYQIWKTQNRNTSYSEMLRLILTYKNTSQSFSDFVLALYNNGHQNVFPLFSKYPGFNDIPEYVLKGNVTVDTDNILLNPYIFWKILSGTLTFYPGNYGDFSVPLSHFELRNCWCVDLDGQKLQGTEMTNKIPKCPGTCELAKLKTTQFTELAEKIISASNTSQFPLGQGFLLANGIRLLESELFNNNSFLQSGVTLSESFMSRDTFSLQLAAQSTLHFYWRRRFADRQSFGETTLLAYLPYVPQCDGLGNWNPVQFYESTGHSWCVDEDGNYIPYSLGTRASSPPQCQTSCQQSQTNALIANWMPQTISSNKRNASEFLIPSCTETGQYSSLQNLEPFTDCVLPSSNDLIMEGVRDINSGFKCPVCPLPFRSQNINHGAVFCEEITEDGRNVQTCQVVCQKGYYNVFSGKTFTCDETSLQWISPTPHLQSCQRVQAFQTVQTKASFQVLLPSSKTCMADYSGLIQSFRTFILDDLKAQGLCHVQVNYFGNRGTGTVPVCDDSTVYVECLSTDRLGVNVTWRAQLQDIQVSALPGLRDIEAAIVGENLVGRFLSIIRSGNYTLTLDSKLFVADNSADFPRDDDFSLSPEVKLGCKEGFRRLIESSTDSRDLGGCAICPAGSFGQGDSCQSCPAGSYQENAGSTSCIKCPPGTNTAYSGTISKSQCMTDCQMNAKSLLCDENGQYYPSQKDEATNTYYCIDIYGEKLKWTEVDTELTNDQCLLLRRFELVPQDQLVFLTGEEISSDVGFVKSSGSKQQLVDCVKDCSMDDACDYLTVSPNGSNLACEQYNGDQSNIICSTTNRMLQGFLGNPFSVNMERLSCQFKIKPTDINSVKVYRKQGHEFPRTGLKPFEKTDFSNTIDGVYNTTVFSAEDTSLTDVHYFCRQTCGQNPCCHGFILSQIILNKGTILCGLLSSPHLLLCNAKDWSETSHLGGYGVCKGVKSQKEQKAFSFFLGSQEFTGSYAMLSKSIGKVEYNTELTAEVKEEIQRRFVQFQKVFLLRDPGERTASNDSECGFKAFEGQNAITVSDSAMDNFFPVDVNDVKVDEAISVASLQFQVAKQRYSSSQAVLWCLTRCLEEKSWCRLADLQDTRNGYYSCIIYPESHQCNNTVDLAPNSCDITLTNKPHRLYHKKESLGTKVKHFYTHLPYQKLSGISVRNKITMTGKSVAKGFFECELHCDADPCCKGFGYFETSQLTGKEVLCLTLGSLGIQSCSSQERSSWHVTNCSSLSNVAETHPYGWYQKPDEEQPVTSALCPPTDPTPEAKEVSLDDWILLDSSSVSIDSSLSEYDTLQLTGNTKNTLRTGQNYCLSACSQVPSCMTTSIEVQQTKTRCIFYPETQSCYHSLKKHTCRVLIKEPATYIYRKKVSPRPLPSLTIPSRGSLFGNSRAILIGSDVKYVNQYLGIPFAAPPVGNLRFHPPQPYNWTGTLNATTARSSCLQPGDGKAQYSSVSEDCLYLNVFVPSNIRASSPVLLYFHNSPSDYSENGQTFIDGSYQAAIGDIIVVIAGYRVGVFGFLSISNAVPSGNWGLLDQAAALKWTHENIAYLGGDPTLISIAADRAGADIASLHLMSPETKPIRRVLLMGGSVSSPMLIISKTRAEEQVRFLATEVGCLMANDEDILTCLRKVDSNVLNEAQTKLLALRGPFQTWGPVIDGVYVRDAQLKLTQQQMSQDIPLLIGTDEQDGLIVRAKAIKRFEEAQGRGDSKTAFYQALQNSLGGEERNPLVQDAAVWFYSLEHSTDDYAGFSRALENATRDHFIACPAVKMAKEWVANTTGSVFMYHVPEDFSQSSSGLDLPADVKYAFGLPFHSNYKYQFSIEEQNLSLKIMRYITNFIKTGNPNYQYTFSRRLSSNLPVWPEHLAHSNGENYKEFSSSLSNKQGLKRAECSFWNKYIPTLKASTSSKTAVLLTEKSIDSGLKSAVTETGPEQEKYN
ncbi:Hypothetical predicted protein [Pelobates cultripes]|uniref:Thyroglobulin n=1 Tax=Pelobates cultripes TaxID=61616 RepID=A0AAD1S416_PELCU|nr:Hypothetical predicted protein [Pelobates cultripes]